MVTAKLGFKTDWCKVDLLVVSKGLLILLLLLLLLLRKYSSIGINN